jgi:hypothetical protein
MTYPAVKTAYFICGVTSLWQTLAVHRVTFLTSPANAETMVCKSSTLWEKWGYGTKRHMKHGSMQMLKSTKAFMIFIA